MLDGLISSNHNIKELWLEEIRPSSINSYIYIEEEEKRKNCNW
jgi:hypothetical protein